MESDFKEYPSTVGEKDYWRQVKRTVNGVPVSEGQITMIVDAISRCLGLDRARHEVLLDIGCGNGALSQMIFDKVSEFHGVDYSEYLISVAKRDFERLPKFSFAVGDACDYLRTEKHPERFTKVLCYGCFSYFSAGEEALALLNQRFPNVTHVFIGNLPDRDRAELFYKNGLPASDELSSHETKIGIWRTQEEFRQMALRTGWELRFHFMPGEFYACHYRYDVILVRNS